MNLKKLSNPELDLGLQRLFSKEKEIFSEIIFHIKEVDTRRLYLSFGFSNLFEYLTRRIGYSEGSAQRRIDAARLAADIPRVIDMLETGELKISQVTTLQKAIREKQARLKIKIDNQTKEWLVDQLVSKSSAETQVIVSHGLDLEIKQSPSIKHQRMSPSVLKLLYQKLNGKKFRTCANYYPIHCHLAVGIRF